MFVFVIGGSASGKSECAENIVCKLAGDDPKFYLATMKSDSNNETRLRIQKHQDNRKDKGFITYEVPHSISSTVRIMKEASSLLLEDLSNLLANEMFSENGIVSSKSFAREIFNELHYLEVLSKNLVIVSNNIFEDTISNENSMYCRELATLNAYIAQAADLCIEVSAGIPHAFKGDLKCLNQ